MPLGDSITYGEALTTVEGGYRNRLYTLLTPPNQQFNPDYVGTFKDTNNPTLPDVDHQGWPGARTDMLRSRIDDWLRQIDDPDVVLLLIGTNDLWQNKTVAATLANLDSLISDIAIRRPFARIIVSNLPPRTDSQTYENLQLQYNAGIPGIVAQHVSLGRQVTQVDIHSALTPFDLSSDGVHPSSSGYNKMAGVWAPAINALTSPKGDANPPVIARTAFPENPTSVSVVFSKPVADDAANPANFSISGGIAITNAVLDAATKRVVTLTTAPQEPGLIRTLSVSGVKDRTSSQTMIAPQSMVVFSASAITNGSFENAYAGWTATGNQDIASDFPYEATDGTNMVAFNGGNSTPNGILSRTFATVSGRTYALTFDMGVLANGNAYAQRLQVSVQGATSLINDTPTLNALGGSGYTVRWSPLRYTFTANSATTTLTFSDVSTVTNAIDLLLDNVRICAPQPRTLSLTSWPASGANMSVTPGDLAGQAGGTTGLIRSYNDGATVTVTAPASLSGGPFLKWRKNGVDMPGSSPVISITMDGNHALTAVYQTPTGPNDPPVGVADAYAATSGGTISVAAPGVLMNDSDPDGAAVTSVLVTQPLHGSLTLQSSGAFTYTPTAGFTGQDSFVYRASDGALVSNNIAVSLTVNPAPPQLMVNGSFESSFSAWTSTGNVSVQSASPYIATDGTRCVSFNTGNQQVNGVLSQSFATTPGRIYTLTFDAGTYSTKSASQRLRTTLDGSGNLLDQTVTLSGSGNGMLWQSFSRTFTANSTTTLLTFRDVSTTYRNIDLVLDKVRISAVPVNQTLEVQSVPEAGLWVGLSPPDPSMSAGGTTGFTRSYPAGTIVNLSAPAVSGGNAFVKWRKNGEFWSSDRNTSVAMDANLSMTAVYQVNATPVANSQTVQFDQGGSIGITLTGTDPDADALTYAVTVMPQHGALSGVAPNLTYTPATDFAGSDELRFTVSDGIAVSAEAVVSIVVFPVNHAPLAISQALVTGEDTALPVTLTGSDVDGDPLIYQVTGGPAHGVLSGNAPNLIYTPTANYHGADSIAFTVSDGIATPVQGTVSITVQSINDAPVANNLSLQTNEDTAVPVTLTGSDVDGGSLTFQVAGGPAHGVLSGDAPNLTYTPSADYHGADSFTFTVSDGIAIPVQGTVSISVIEVGGTPFEEWAAIHGIDPDPIADTDGDSVNNAVEYVIGGDPGDNSDGGLLPQGTVPMNQPGGVDPQAASGDRFCFTYRMARRVRNDVLTQVTVEWCSDPAGPWTVADGSHGETTEVEEGAVVDLTHVFIPLNPGEGRLFARLRVTISPEP